MRELTLKEKELIAGGSDSSFGGDWGEIVVTADGGGDYDGGGGGDGEIVVTADGGGDGADGSDPGDYGDYGDYGDGGGDQGGDGGDGGQTTDYPVGFDFGMDPALDQMAKSIAQQIAGMPNSDKIEYGAIIWRDAAGVLHTTTIATGNVRETPLAGIWGQVDFANGGKIVSIIHSHPTVYNAASEENPIWMPVQDPTYPSSADFDFLMSTLSNPQYGYDSANYRTYIVVDGEAHEYYAFDQDPAYVGAGAQATWAVESSDYETNTTP